MKKSVRLLLAIFSLTSSAFAATTLPHMSAEQLKTFDGQNGHKSYVALNGYVYDVSGIMQWKGGKHFKKMKAGTDLTPYIDQSPHGPDIVNTMKLKPIAVYP